MIHESEKKHNHPWVLCDTPPLIVLLGIEFIDIPTEQTTAATNVLLAGVAAGCGLALARRRQRAPWKVGLWGAAFGVLTLAAILGASAHGFKMPPQTYHLLWQPLNLLLGSLIALFVAGVVCDAWGKQASRRVLPPMLLAGVAFYLFTLANPGSFLVFVAYQTVCMLFALGVYSWLAWRKRQAGTAWMAAGVLTTMVAAGIQASGQASLHLVWPFDHNGIYHLVQIVGVLLLFVGLRRSLREPAADAKNL